MQILKNHLYTVLSTVLLVIILSLYDYFNTFMFMLLCLIWLLCLSISIIFIDVSRRMDFEHQAKFKNYKKSR